MECTRLTETVIRIHLQQMLSFRKIPDDDIERRECIIMCAGLYAVHIDVSRVGDALEYKADSPAAAEVFCKSSDAPVGGKLGKALPAARYNDRELLPLMLSVLR